MPAFAAPFVFDGHQLLADHTVELEADGTVQRLSPGVSPAATQLDGLLLPGLINAHCHLEFSNLNGRIPPGVGMTGFIRQLTALRDQDSEAHRVNAAVQALQTLRAQGVVHVLDTSNSAIGSQAGVQVPGIAVQPIVEVLGLNPASAEAAYQKGKALASQLAGSPGLTPHAPYSVAPALWQRLAADNPSMWSYHLLESNEEVQWFATRGGGPFGQLFSEWGIDSTPPFSDPIAPLAQFLPPETRLGAVHLTQATPADTARLRALTDYLWCVLCPQANRYLHGRLPSATAFLPTDRICLGTDSLAGTWAFDFAEELRLLLSEGFAFETLLAALTRHPAAWLGLEDTLGGLRPGLAPGLALLEDAGLSTQLARGTAPTLTPIARFRRVA